MRRHTLLMLRGNLQKIGLCAGGFRVDDMSVALFINEQTGLANDLL